LSFSNHSTLFGRDKKGIIRVLTISLFFVGLTAAALFAYQQLTKPALPIMSKDNAIAIAYKAGNWNEQTLKDKHAEATLVHVKANGFSFVVDYENAVDTLKLYHTPFPQYEDQYLWIVKIIAPSNREWVSVINAETSELLEQSF
jgi:hypothetical protein